MSTTSSAYMWERCEGGTRGGKEKRGGKAKMAMRNIINARKGYIQSGIDWKLLQSETESTLGIVSFIG